MVLPRNLAFDDIIDEQWTDAVVNNLTDLVPSTGGVVYGVDHYHAALPANTTLTAVLQTLITIPMPAAPAGTLLDISCMCYVNQGTVGTGSTFISLQVGGVTAGPTLVVGDRVQLETYTARVVNAVAPVGAAYNITLVGTKATSSGSIILQGANSTLDVVSFRP